MKNQAKTPKPTETGVIIGRFQVHELHQGHKFLIKRVMENHKRVIIFLGISPILHSIRNPLDYESRLRMLQNEYPEILVTYINDKADDELRAK